jgi:inactivated superfamily I helicase
MSWKREMLRSATPEQCATIKRLSQEVAWQTYFNDWLETRFAREHAVPPRGAAQAVIDALENKLRNQKSPVAISDPEQPATAEQLATIERLSKAIKWGTGFDRWLRKKSGIERVELYGQAEGVIAMLQKKLKAQLCGHDAGHAALEPAEKSHTAAKRIF